MKRFILPARSNRYSIQYVFMLLPAVLIFIVFLIYPLFGGIYYSLTDWDGISPKPVFIGLANYVTFFSDFYILRPLINTFIFAFCLTIIQNIISLFFAFCIYHETALNKYLRIALFIPVALSPLLVGYIWSFLYTVPIAQFGKTLGIDIIANNLIGHPKTALLAGIFTGAWRMMGWTMVIYIAALQGIPQELYEAARVDGASTFRQHLEISMPLIIPAFTINIIMTLQRGFKEFALMFALTQGGPGNASELLSMTIYTESFQYFRAAYGSAMGVILFIIVVIFSIVQLRYFRKKEESIYS